MYSKGTVCYNIDHKRWSLAGSSRLAETATKHWSSWTIILQEAITLILGITSNPEDPIKSQSTPKQNSVLTKVAEKVTALNWAIYGAINRLTKLFGATILSRSSSSVNGQQIFSLWNVRYVTTLKHVYVTLLEWLSHNSMPVLTVVPITRNVFLGCYSFIRVVTSSFRCS